MKKEALKGEYSMNCYIYSLIHSLNKYIKWCHVRLDRRSLASGSLQSNNCFISVYCGTLGKFHNLTKPRFPHL